MAKPGKILHHFFQPKETFAAGIGLIPSHHRSPLFNRHRAGAGIREQIQQHINGPKPEKIVPSLLQEGFSLIRGGIGERLYAFDTERFNDGFQGGNL